MPEPRPPIGRRPGQPIPLTVLTGFLGAGKTTLLNRLLRDPAFADTAVLINEFGDVGLDHLLVETVADNTVLLSSGCLCCTVRCELVDALEGLLRALDNGRLRFRRVVVETTGLADPAPVLHTIMAHPYLVQRFRLDGVVTLVDAVNGGATLDAHPEALKQAAVADVLVLTKTDLPEGAAAGEVLVARLRGLNPAAPVLEAARGEASADRLLERGLYDPEGKIPDVKRWLGAEAHAASHAHGHHHHHDVNRHDERIRAAVLTTAQGIPIGTLEMFIDLLRSLHGPNLLRLKGIVKTAEAPERPLVIHGVQHVFHPPAHLPGWPDGDERTRIVVITRDLSPDTVRALFEAFLDTAKPDAPDRAALLDNPLVPFGGRDR